MISPPIGGVPEVSGLAEKRPPASWLTGEVRMDPFLLEDAQYAYADRGGGAAGYLAARRLLDEGLRRMVHWPRARDYAQLAEDLAAEGRDGDAVLLRRVAAAGEAWPTRPAGIPGMTPAPKPAPNAIPALPASAVDRKRVLRRSCASAGI